MKSIRHLLSAMTLFFSVASLSALNPVRTFTFVDPCFPFVSVSPIANTHNCFAVSFMNNTANQSYSINFGNGESVTGTETKYCYPVTSTASQYTISITNLAPGCAANAYDVYTVTLAPPSSSICTYTATLTRSASTVSLCCGSLIPEISYKNDFGDGTGEQNTDVHTYASCGNYIVKRRRFDMNDPNDCYIFVAANIPCPPVVTGINKQALSQARVYPNPAGNVITVTSDALLKQAQVFDMLGRKIIDTPLKNFKDTATIETATLVPGTYFLLLQLEDGSSTHIKFIKE